MLIGSMKLYCELQFRPLLLLPVLPLFVSYDLLYTPLFQRDTL